MGTCFVVKIIYTIFMFAVRKIIVELFKKQYRKISEYCHLQLLVKDIYFTVFVGA